MENGWVDGWVWRGRRGKQEQGEGGYLFRLSKRLSAINQMAELVVGW